MKVYFELAKLYLKNFNIELAEINVKRGLNLSNC